MKLIELKQCPFCFYFPKIGRDPEIDSWYIECENCKVSMLGNHRESQKRLINRWNNCNANLALKILKKELQDERQKHLI